MQYLGRLSDGRTPTFSQTDLYAQHDFKLGGDRLAGQLQRSEPVGPGQRNRPVEDQASPGQGIVIDEVTFYQGFNTHQLIDAQDLRRDARFLLDWDYQSPRTVRLGREVHVLRRAAARRPLGIRLRPAGPLPAGRLFGGTGYARARPGRHRSPAGGLDPYRRSEHDHPPVRRHTRRHPHEGDGAAAPQHGLAVPWPPRTSNAHASRSRRPSSSSSGCRQRITASASHTWA